MDKLLIIRGRVNFFMQIEIRGAEKLSFREKQVVTLREMGTSVDKIAKKLKISSSTVATLLSRAKSKGYQVVIVIPGDSLNIFDYDDDDDDNDDDDDDDANESKDSKE